MKRVFALLAVLAVVVYGLPVLDPAPLELRWVDANGVDRPCPPSRAQVTQPDRQAPSPFALFQDLAYAAAAGGPDGAALLVLLLAVPVALFGMWCRGFSCGLRRAWVTLGVGVPLFMGLIYTSCFLEGRSIQLGADAVDQVMANLNTKTDASTGVLRPKAVLAWHYRHDVRVINVADRGRIDSARAAVARNRQRPFQPPLLVLAGEERRMESDIVLLNVPEPPPPRSNLGELATAMRDAGGATFLAHPWSRKGRPIADALKLGVDGTELVNGVIHGGQSVVAAARRAGRTGGLIGTTALKFGPHLNAVTLLPRDAARSGKGVAQAIRAGVTEVLYAVPGGTVSAEAFEANQLQTVGLLPALRTLLETPRMRRTVWLGTILLVAALWWLSIATVRQPQLNRRIARLLFFLAGMLLLALPFALHWKFRASVGVIPMIWLILSSAPFVLVLLATTHNLALYEEATE